MNITLLLSLQFLPVKPCVHEQENIDELNWGKQLPPFRHGLLAVHGLMNWQRFPEKPLKHKQFGAD